MAENRVEISGKGGTYIVTRRTVHRQGKSYVRIRIRAWKGVIAFGTPEWNEFKDFGPGEWGKGDETFTKFIKKIKKHVGMI